MSPGEGLQKTEILQTFLTPQVALLDQKTEILQTFLTRKKKEAVAVKSQAHKALTSINPKGNLAACFEDPIVRILNCGRSAREGWGVKPRALT